MKVFISWSGKTSGQLAKVLREWLPSVIQVVKPHYSSDDIEKGSRGNRIMGKELEEAEVGVLCLTRENLEAPWIMFEAGALSKRLDKSRVCPILFDGLGTTDLKGPLVNFQAANFNKEGMRKVVGMMNSQLGDNKLEEKVLDVVFGKFWPDIEEKVKGVLSTRDKAPRRELRNDRELLEEILTLSRSIERRGQSEVVTIDRDLDNEHLETLKAYIRLRLEGGVKEEELVQALVEGFDLRPRMAILLIDEVKGQLMVRKRRKSEEKGGQNTR